MEVTQRPADPSGLQGALVPTAQQLEHLMATSDHWPGTDPTVSGLHRVFGGNARSAWSFRLSTPDGPVGAIALMQHPLGQIETNLAHEFDILSQLSGTGMRAPRPLALDTRAKYLDVPTIVLELLPGQGSAGGFLNMPETSQGLEILTDLARQTALLHSVSESWVDPGTPSARYELALGQLDHWEQAFDVARRGPLPALSSVFGWLRAHLPVPERIAIVHGDLRPGNFLYVDAQVSAILDWEMSHLGDPVEDLAWMYCRLWSPTRFMSADDFLDVYAQSAGALAPPDVFRYYQVFCEAKFAAISLKASRLFSDGTSSNMRHADRFSEALLSAHRCLELIDSDGRI